MPGASPGKSSPVGAPNPKDRSAASKRVLPSCRAMRIVPTFDESRTMSATLSSAPWECTSAYFWPSTTIWLGTWIFVLGFTSPASSAAAIVTTLFVEPGSNTSVRGRFWVPADDGFAAVNGVAPSTVAIARMSPVRTSARIAVPPFALAVPTSSARTRSTSYCSDWSIVSSRSSPDFGSFTRRSPSGSSRPCGSRSTSMRPALPASGPSWPASSPARPLLSMPTKPSSGAARSPAG